MEAAPDREGMVIPFWDWGKHFVAGRGPERRRQRHRHADEYPMVCIDHGYLFGWILVAKHHKTGIKFALPVVRK